MQLIICSSLCSLLFACHDGSLIVECIFSSIIYQQEEWRHFDQYSVWFCCHRSRFAAAIYLPIELEKRELVFDAFCHDKMTEVQYCHKICVGKEQILIDSWVMVIWGLNGDMLDFGFNVMVQWHMTNNCPAMTLMQNRGSLTVNFSMGIETY